MSPRLEAAARYHQRFRLFVRLAGHWQPHTPEFASRMEQASRLYVAAMNELHPEKAKVP